MKGYIVIFSVVIIGCCFVGPTLSEEGKDGQKSTSKPTVAVTTTTESSSHPNTTVNCTEYANCTRINQGLLDMVSKAFMENRGMVQRAFYVLMGVTSLVLLYFVVKTVRLRRRQSKSKKYGVISTRGQDNLEMIPLDQDDEDEDMTVFEVNGHPR